jgi:hypothetical protein
MPEHAYPCTQVPYTHEKAQYCRAKRTSMAEVSAVLERVVRAVPAIEKVRAFGGRNLATFFFTDGTYTHEVTMASESAMAVGTRGIPTRHSERACWDAIRWGSERDPRHKILWVYTEREPCGDPPIGQRCNRLLAEILERHGQDGLRTPVYYSFPYPDYADVREYETILAATLGDELAAEERHDAAVDMAAWSRAEATSELQDVDAAARRARAASPGFGAAVAAKRDALM